MEVKAYMCKHCNALFKTKKGAANCESRCEEVTNKQKADSLSKQALLKEQEDIRLKSKSIEDIVKGCIAYQNKVSTAGKLLDIKFDVRYCENASNSHSSPIGKQENWARDKSKPTGYPALYGRVTFLYSFDPLDHCVGSSILRFIHTGSGGGGGTREGYELSYDVTLWLDDFPLIKKSVENALSLNLELKGKIEESYEKLNKAILDSQEYQEILTQKKAISDKIENLNKELYKLDLDSNVIYSEINKPLKDSLSNFKASIDNPFKVSLEHINL